MNKWLEQLHCMQEVSNLNPRTSTGFRDPEKISSVEPSRHKKWSFPLRICEVNVTKSAGSWKKSKFFKIVLWKKDAKMFYFWFCSSIISPLKSTVTQKKVHLLTGLLLLKMERNRIKATIPTITDIIFLQFTVFPYKFNSP